MARSRQVALILSAMMFAPVTAHAAPSGDYLNAICVVEKPPRFKEAERIGDLTPTYPRSALSSWSEGWVDVAFEVSADGSVQNPTVADTTGQREFIRAAIAAVSRQRFRPATRNGTPVAQYLRAASIVFKFSDSAPVAEHPGFIEQYKGARRALQDNEPDNAIRKLERAFGERLNMYEVSLGSFMLAVAYEQKQDWHWARHYIEQAVYEDAKYLDRDTRVSARELLFRSRVETGDAAGAACAFRWLAQESRPAMEALYQETQARLLANVPLVAGVRLDKHPRLNEPASWQRRAVRRRFSFADVSGTIASVRLSCFDMAKEAAFDAKEIWMVPEQNGTCFVRVTGSPGTTFKFVQEW